jgi:WD40 repeat protein
LIAFGAQNGGIRIWQIPAGDVVADILAHGRVVQFVGFSPDGRRLVSTSIDQGVRVWSIPDGEMVYDLTDYSLTPLIAVFSPDSQHLAVAHKTGIQVWSMETGQQEFFIAAADYAASSALHFSPDGKLLAGCGAQPVIGVWNTADGAFLGGLPVPGQVCANIAFSPDGTLLLTLPSPGRDVFLWDITHITDDVPPEEKLLTRGNRQNFGLYPGAQFHDIAWSPDGRFIVLVDDLGPMYVLTAAE